MQKIALTLPWSDAAGGKAVIDNPGMNTALFQDANGQITIGAAISRFAIVALYAGGVLMFIWAAWGVFDYIKAEGNKESLAKARKKIQWAVTGFIILIFAFFLSDYLQVILLGGPATRTLSPLSL